MDHPDSAGELAARSLSVRDVDIQRRELAKCAFELWYSVERYGHRDHYTLTFPETLERLAQKIAKGDRALQAKILRCWGVRG